MTAPVLLCYDGSESAEQAIAAAGELLGGGDATVVNVWQAASDAMVWDPITGVQPIPETAMELEGYAEQAAKRVAAEGAAKACEAGFAAEPVAVRGDGTDWHSIVALAEERSARAIVIGSRGLSRVRSAVLGSVSNGVAHHARCPVLVVRAD